MWYEFIDNIIMHVDLTHSGLVMPYGDINSGSTLSQAMVCNKQAATWTIADILPIENLEFGMLFTK